jgi:hypothetical protein
MFALRLRYNGMIKQVASVIEPVNLFKRERECVGLKLYEVMTNVLCAVGLQSLGSVVK